MEYKTVKNEASDMFTEKRSKFIGYCKPVKSEEEAADFIASKKTEHWDAKHNVYAYILRNGQIKRYSDDGEPGGTAGMPVLEVIQRSNVTDVVVVVTRYFGGILLGTGGLVRAYSLAARLALEAGKIITMRECIMAEILCEYTYYGKVSAVISDCGGVIDNEEFLDNVRLNMHISEENFDPLNKKLADATSGNVAAEIKAKAYFEFL